MWLQAYGDWVPRDLVTKGYLPTSMAAPSYQKSVLLGLSGWEPRAGACAVAKCLVAFSKFHKALDCRTRSVELLVYASRSILMIVKWS